MTTCKNKAQKQPEQGTQMQTKPPKRSGHPAHPLSLFFPLRSLWRLTD
ncbi:MAG: hypothetical protein AAGE84_28160 [Cyanobacteria bacterium P01_G01_bin.39]